MAKEEVVKPKVHVHHAYYSGGFAFPLILIFFGFYFLAKNMGWISEKITIWPILFIGIGLYLIFKRVRRT